VLDARELKHARHQRVGDLLAAGFVGPHVRIVEAHRGGDAILRVRELARHAPKPRGRRKFGVRLACNKEAAERHRELQLTGDASVRRSGIKYEGCGPQRALFQRRAKSCLLVARPTANGLHQVRHKPAPPLEFHVDLTPRLERVLAQSHQRVVHERHPQGRA